MRLNLVLSNSEIVTTKLMSGQMRGRFPDQDEDVVALTAAPESVSSGWYGYADGRMLSSTTA